MFGCHDDHKWGKDENGEFQVGTFQPTKQLKVKGAGYRWAIFTFLHDGKPHKEAEESTGERQSPPRLEKQNAQQDKQSHYSKNQGVRRVDTA